MSKRGNGVSSDTVKKARSRRFNFIDVLIILAVLLLAAIVISIFSPRSWLLGGESKSMKNIQYTVEFTNVDQSFVDKISENDNVVDSVSKFSLGKVSAVDNGSHYMELQYNEGTGLGEFASYPDKYNLLITVSVEAEYEEGVGYSVNDKRIAIGEKMSLRFPDYVGEGYCIGIMVND